MSIHGFVSGYVLTGSYFEIDTVYRIANFTQSRKTVYRLNFASFKREFLLLILGQELRYWTTPITPTGSWGELTLEIRWSYGRTRHFVGIMSLMWPDDTLLRNEDLKKRILETGLTETHDRIGFRKFLWNVPTSAHFISGVSWKPF